jgi:hypothetical protein
MQQRCHHASASARSPSWPSMPRPRLQRAATARREKVQLRIREQSWVLSRRIQFSSKISVKNRSLTRRSAWLAGSRSKLEGSVGSWRWLTWRRARSARPAKNAGILLSNAQSEAKRPRCWIICRTVSSLWVSADTAEGITHLCSSPSSPERLKSWSKISSHTIWCAAVRGLSRILQCGPEIPFRCRKGNWGVYCPARSKMELSRSGSLSPFRL